jgi:MFS family permease
MRKLNGIFTVSQWILLSVCFFLLAFHAGMSYTFGIFLKPLVEEFSWSRSWVSAAYSIHMFTLALSTVLMGGLSDRYGARKVMFGGVLVYVISLLFSSTINSLWQLYLLVGILVGLGRSSVITPLYAYIQNSFPRNRGLATGLAGAGQGFGMLLFPPLTGFIIAAYGWRNAYIFLGVVLLVFMTPLVMLLRPPASGPGKPPAKAGDTPEQRETELLPEAALGLSEIVKRRPFWAVLGSHIFDCNCHSVVIVHLVPFAIEAGIPRIQATTLIGALGVGNALGRVAIGVLADRVGAKRALGTALLLQTIPVPFLLLVGTFSTLMAITFVIGLGLGGHGTMYPVVTRSFYGPKRIGLLYGTFTSGASFGMATGAFMGGLLYDLSGDYTLSFVYSFGVGVISLLLVWSYPSRRPLAGPSQEVPSAVSPVVS